MDVNENYSVTDVNTPMMPVYEYVWCACMSVRGVCGLYLKVLGPRRITCCLLLQVFV